jgi:hypothetical protein
MSRTDPTNTPKLCPMCRVAVGYFLDPEGLCPRCAAVVNEAGE